VRRRFVDPFLETVPRGEVRKRGRGGAAKGPCERPRPACLSTSASTASAKSRAEGRLGAGGRSLRSPVNPMLHPWRMMWRSEATKGRSG
jgi:hypothetical protein